MLNSSEGTRKFSKERVVILAVALILFIAVNPLYAYVSSLGSMSVHTTTTEVTSSIPTQVTTITSQTSTGYQSTSTANSSTIISGNQISSVTSAISDTTYSMNFSETQVTTQTTTTTTSSSTSSTVVLYTISLSKLQTWFKSQGLNQSGVKFAQSSSKVPYFIVTEANSSTLLLYLDTDVDPIPCYGYNAPIGTLVLVNTTGTIENLTIYSIYDTYGSYMITQTWLNTYVGRNVFEGLQIGVDANPVTGATISSEGVINGVRDAGRLVVDDYQSNYNSSKVGNVSLLGAALNVFGSLKYDDMDLQNQLSVAALILLFAGAVVAFELKSYKIRYTVSVGSIIFIGFYAVRMVTMGDFEDFITRRLPPFSGNLYFYVLYGGVLCTSLIWGRIYCGYLCPFGTFTDIVNKISPIKLKVPYKYESKLRLVKYVILAVVIFDVYEMIGGMTLYQIEPFETFFLLAGTALAWTILGLLLITSVFLNRFYCTYICPAGTALGILAWFRIREIKRWPECKTCNVCSNQCARQAIKADRVSPLECMACRECEKLYLNRKICPHYAKERILEKQVVNSGASGADRLQSLNYSSDIKSLVRNDCVTEARSGS